MKMLGSRITIEVLVDIENRTLVCCYVDIRNVRHVIGSSLCYSYLPSQQLEWYGMQIYSCLLCIMHKGRKYEGGRDR